MMNMHGVELQSASQQLIEVDATIRRNTDDLVNMVRRHATSESIYEQAEFIDILRRRRETQLRKLARLGVSEADFYNALRWKNEEAEEDALA